jgi:hypothetical protein
MDLTTFHNLHVAQLHHLSHELIRRLYVKFHVDRAGWDEDVFEMSGDGVVAQKEMQARADVFIATMVTQDDGV